MTVSSSFPRSNRPRAIQFSKTERSRHATCAEELRRVPAGRSNGPWKPGRGTYGTKSFPSIATRSSEAVGDGAPPDSRISRESDARKATFAYLQEELAGREAQSGVVYPLSVESDAALGNQSPRLAP